VLLLFLTVTAAPLVAQTLPTIDDKTRGFDKLDGYVPMYWDRHAGTLWMEIARFDTELLYMTGLSTGLGSNDIGLDRGQLGGRHVVVFRRVGAKVLLEEQNYGYRAVGPNADERRAVDEAFAKSVLRGSGAPIGSFDAGLMSLGEPWCGVAPARHADFSADRALTTRSTRIRSAKIGATRV
jgi:hypothetical protein